MGRFGSGQAYRRLEDQRFLTGTGRYTDDIAPEAMAHLHFLRSPFAHGEIQSIDTATAAAMPGVLAIYTTADLDTAGIPDIPVVHMPPDRNGVVHEPLPRPTLARGRVRYVGEPVAAVIAETKAAAIEASEAIEFDVRELPAVGTLHAALTEGAPAIWEQCPGNVFGEYAMGDAEAVRSAFDKAARTVSVDLINNRVAPTALEPRGCVAVYDDETTAFTLYQGSQGVHTLRRWLSQMMFKIPEDKLRVIAPDVGGGFGLKMFLQNEPIATMFAARALKRPVKWIGDRSESFLSDIHGRDHKTHAELALDGDGRILAMRIADAANVGAYISQAGVGIAFNAGTPMSTGAYAIPSVYAESRITVTNTTPVDAYRGAGRPEALYLIERLLDAAGRETGLGPAEIRRRNFVQPDAFPYTSALGRVFDSGDYEKQLDLALERADVSGFDQRRADSETRGLLRGLGIGFYVEVCAIASNETPHVTLTEDGGAVVLMGTQSTGQGHETAYAQMVADELGLPLNKVKVIQGDTDLVPTGRGTSGSRSLPIGGGALANTIDQVIDNSRQVAAELLEAATQDIEFDGGTFRIAGTDRTVSLAEVVAVSYDDNRRPADVETGLHAAVTFEVTEGTYPSGCHVCEVEVDPATGVVKLLRYTVQDDVGTVINPLLLEGQVIGGVVQGIGQAMVEHAVYDDDSAQLLTGSFMDYGMPRADNLPMIDTYADAGVPSPRNPLGAKGAGEAGTIGAPATVVHAVLNALAPLGVTHLDMPLTPLSVWQAIEAART